MSEPSGVVGLGSPTAASSKITPAARDPRLVEALEEYLGSFETGNAPDRQEFLSRHPEIASTLMECLEGLDFIRAAAVQVRELAVDQRAVATESREFQPQGPLGDYQIVREIGRGGMGVVYEAEQISLGRRVALKVLPFAAVLDHRQLQRFKNEAQAAALLHHQNIVPVHGIGCERGVHYYAMQYIEGQTLAQVIASLRYQAGLETEDRPHIEPKRGESSVVDATLAYRPSPEQAQRRLPDTDEEIRGILSTERSTKQPAYFCSIARMGIQAAEGLEHAHSEGVLHRDVKPSNLLLDSRGKVWITDFGLARIGTERDLTMSGDLIGTLRYMSPEQALAKRVIVDHRTDIYSLGLTLYELLTLQPAFDGRDRQELLRQIAFEEPSPPRRLNSSIPAELETIVLKAIAKNPDERYGTAQELADDLERFLKDEPIRAKRPTLPQRARKWARRHQSLVRSAIAMFLLAVAALAASTALIWRAKNEAEHALDRERYGAYIQRIGLAERELSVNNLARAEELLEQCPPELRGWEWHYLKRQRCQSIPPLRLRAAVWGAAVSPDGQSIASADVDGWIRIWNAQTGHELRGIRAFPSQASSVAFSPDGQRVACGNWIGPEDCAKIFDVRTGQELVVMKSEVQRDINSVAFSPDGRLLATAGCSGPWEEPGTGEVILWDAATGQRLATLMGHGRNVHGLAFSPDGSMLASGGIEGDRSVKLWKVETRREILSLPGHSRRVNGIAFSADSMLMASGSGHWGHQSSGEVKLWDPVTGRELRTLRGHFDGIWSLAFSPDGTRLATGGEDMTAKIWDVATGQETLTLRGHTNWVTAVAFTRQGDRLISASFDRTIRIWNGTPWREGETCQELLTFVGHQDGVNSVAYSPDGRHIASGGADGTARIWDAWTGRERHTIRATAGQVGGVAFSPDSRQLALCTWGVPENLLGIWDVESGREIKAMRGMGESYSSSCVAFSPSAQLIASGGSNFTVNLWNPITDEFVQSPREKFAINSVSFTPDGKRVASACEDGAVALWDTTTGEEVARLPSEHDDRVVGVVFSRDGKMLVTSSWDRTVIIRRQSDEDTDWRPQHVVRDLSGGAEGVAISSDNRRVAWGSTDSTVKVWDADTGEIQTLRGHRSWVHGVAFSPDGRRIASASQDGTIKVWELPPVSANVGR